MAYMCLYGNGECDACGRCVLKRAKCPVCGEEPESHLYSSDGAIIGCDQCIDTVDVDEYEEDK